MYVCVYIYSNYYTNGTAAISTPTPYLTYLFLVQAKTDTIDALETYRNRSQPTFLLYSVCELVPN